MELYYNSLITLNRQCNKGIICFLIRNRTLNTIGKLVTKIKLRDILIMNGQKYGILLLEIINEIKIIQILNKNNNNENKTFMHCGILYCKFC